MLQKDKSATKSSKSGTSSTGHPLDTPVQFVKGVGPRLGMIFNSRDIHTVKELLTFFPRAYEDRSKLLTISQLKEAETATVALEVIGSRKIMTRTGRSILEVRCKDSTGVMTLKWFHAPRGMESKFTPGTSIIVTGTIKLFMNRPEIMHPEITWGKTPDTPDANVGRVVPIYTEIEGVSSRVLRKILFEALQKFSHDLGEDLPERYLLQHGLPKLAAAIKYIHFPSDESPALVEFNTPAHWRLVYEEFFKFEYLVLRQRLKMEKAIAPPFGKEGGPKAIADLTASLPFKLTGDQKTAIEDIAKDLSKPHPMNRLIQGDVGSGKTAVALLTAGLVLAEGGQVALMAPTEILAEQHFKNAKKLFGIKLNTALLTGKTPQSERRLLHQRLQSGEPILLIGTHALIEDEVVFKYLTYILIDEQHRFGVEQRRTLRTKGTRKDPTSGKTILPHTLILTATPIPRTLALTAYGDLSVSTIKEMPPGRTPIITKVFRGDAKGLAYETIRAELKKGHQAYFIYPLVNESEAEGFTNLKAAVTESDYLAKEVFPEFKVGLLHGQLKSDEKAKVMEQFQKNEVQILVSTTVVEVGVDVPNSTIMVIEHAERFGLSQLHQLRGRVGRGAQQSFCFLFAATRVGETTATRLEVLEDTHDGFKIAEADLEIRGPGEFLGTRQSGGLPFRLANIVRDREWLLKARDDVTELIQQDPNLEKPEHLPLRRYFEREGNLQFERLKTS